MDLNIILHAVVGLAYPPPKKNKNFKPFFDQSTSIPVKGLFSFSSILGVKYKRSGVQKFIL